MRLPPDLSLACLLEDPEADPAFRSGGADFPCLSPRNPAILLPAGNYVEA